MNYSRKALEKLEAAFEADRASGGGSRVSIEEIQPVTLSAADREWILTHCTSEEHEMMRRTLEEEKRRKQGPSV